MTRFQKGNPGGSVPRVLTPEAKRRMAATNDSAKGRKGKAKSPWRAWNPGWLRG